MTVSSEAPAAYEPTAAERARLVQKELRELLETLRLYRLQTEQRIRALEQLAGIPP